MRNSVLVAIAVCTLGTCSQVTNSFCSASEPLLRPGDRVAIVGGTFVERMQYCGALQSELQCRRPEWRLKLRNLGWSGDNVFAVARKGFDSPADGMKRLLSDLEVANPTVLLLAYGFSEASNDEVKSGQFENGYRQLITTLSEKPYRLVLVCPLAMPGYRGSQYATSISTGREIVTRISKESALSIVDAPWAPEADLLEPNHLLPNPAGYAMLARFYADALVGGEDCGRIPDSLTAEIIEKNRLFFHRHRPQNETYLLLFRKHEQGQNAAEIPQFDPLIEAADQAIWAAAK